MQVGRATCWAKIDRSIDGTVSVEALVAVLDVFRDHEGLNCLDEVLCTARIELYKHTKSNAGNILTN